MTFYGRAAIIAATTFFLAAVVGATTPGVAQVTDNIVFAATNDPEQPQVPTMAEALADLQSVDVHAAQTSAELTLQTESDYATLAAAVAAQPLDVADSELNCLAAGVYHESKGEPLEGQLAVAEVILNRTQSGRFPDTVCGVLTQRGQFSFVRGGQIPQPREGSRAWKTALAVAKVARADSWDSRVDNALFFHARHVSPRWRLARVGSVGNHIFYR